jgi:hypothetical protein
VPKVGYCNAGQAEKYIGPDGWRIVQRQGGWTYICENLGRNLNPGTFQAQLRDQLLGEIQYGGAIEAKVLAMPVRKQASELTAPADILKFIADRNPDDGGAA